MLTTALLKKIRGFWVGHTWRITLYHYILHLKLLKPKLTCLKTNYQLQSEQLGRTTGHEPIHERPELAWIEQRAGIGRLAALFQVSKNNIFNKLLRS